MFWGGNRWSCSWASRLLEYLGARLGGAEWLAKWTCCLAWSVWRAVRLLFWLSLQVPDVLWAPSGRPPTGSGTHRVLPVVPGFLGSLCVDSRVLWLWWYLSCSWCEVPRDWVGWLEAVSNCVRCISEEGWGLKMTVWLPWRAGSTADCRRESWFSWGLVPPWTCQI